MGKLVGNTNFFVVELDEREDGPEIQEYMGLLTGGRTVPRVFIDKEFIGGADELTALDQSGKLAALLREKGISVHRRRRVFFL